MLQAVQAAVREWVVQQAAVLQAAPAAVREGAVQQAAAQTGAQAEEESVPDWLR